MKRLSFLFLLLALGVAAQSINTNQINLSPTVTPPATSAVHVKPTGNVGTATCYYWVIATTSGVPSVPVAGFSKICPNSITSGNSVTIDWTPVPGATYAVLHTTSAAIPSGTCTCAVTTNTSLSRITDTGSYSSYTTIPYGLPIQMSYTNSGTGAGAVPEFIWQYNGNTFFTCLVNANCSGSSSVNPANTFYFSQNCPTGDSKCFPIYGDGKVAIFGTWTASTNTLTTSSNDPPFACPNNSYPCSTGGDVGKVEFGQVQCPLTNPGQCNFDEPQGTITSIQSAHAATVSANFTDSSSGSDGNYFAWGTLDDTHIANLMTAVLANYGGTIQLPCNVNILISQPAFIRNVGSITPSSGPYTPIILNGCSTGVLIPVPNFAFNNCVNGCIYYDNISAGQNAWNAGPGIITTVSNVSVFGLGHKCNPCTSSSTALAAVYLKNQRAYNLNMTGWGWNYNFAGVIADEGGIFDSSTSYAVGKNACQNKSTLGFISYFLDSLCNSVTGFNGQSGQTVLRDSYFYDMTGSGLALTGASGTVVHSYGNHYSTYQVLNGMVMYSDGDLSDGIDSGFGGAFVRGNSTLYSKGSTYNGLDALTVDNFVSGTPTYYDLGGNTYGVAPTIGATVNIFGFVQGQSIPYTTFNSATATNILAAVPTAGQYTLTIYGVVTTNFTSCSTISINVTWNDGTATRAVATNFGGLTTSNGVAQFSQVVYLAAGQALTYNPSESGTCTAGAAQVYATAIPLH